MELVREDRRARKILFDRFWNAAGWRTRSEWFTSEPDLAYARGASYMFEPRSESHDEWVAMAIAACAKVTLGEAAAAFVASLSTRKLAWRSALGSLASLRHLEPHGMRPWTSSGMCAECGISPWECGLPPWTDTWMGVVDLDVMSFERHKWGGARLGDVIYGWFDLDLFRRTERTAETPRDVQMLNDILYAIRRAAADDRPADLERTIATIIPSSRNERRNLLGALAACGVLRTPGHPAPLSEWVPRSEREPPPKPLKNDWHYPTFWWRGSFGIDEDAATAVFDHRLT